jgi:hypothetical protein
MSDRYFPSLPEGFTSTMMSLRAIIQDDPDFFSDPDCPYETEERRLLAVALSPRTDGVPSLAAAAVYDEDFEVTDEVILGSIEDLYRDLKNFGDQVQRDGVDPKDRAAYFRMAVALTDKIVSLREKALRLRDWKAFMAMIMDWLEGVEPEVRTDLIDLIAEWGAES